jgi:hypothetical protein
MFRLSYLEDNLGTADEVTTMPKAFGAAVLALLWLAAAPGRAYPGDKFAPMK